MLLSVLDFAMRDGLILDNPARVAVPIRKVPKAKIIIPTQAQFPAGRSAARQDHESRAFHRHTTFDDA